MIETALYIALGFLTATLLGFLIMPAVWRRAVRLTKRRIEASVPLTRAEILADRDQMAAEYAMRVRRLEMGVGALRRRVADHMAEVTRRGDAIRTLTAERNAALLKVEDLGAKVALLDPKSQGEDTVIARMERLEAENRALAAAAEDARRDVVTMERNTGAVLSERAVLADERTRLDAEIARLKDIIAAKSAEIDATVARYEHQIAAMMSDVSDARATRAEAATRLASGATELAALRAEREMLVMKLASAQSGAHPAAALPDVMPTGANAAHALDSLERERADLEFRLAESRRERDALAAELETLRAASAAAPVVDPETFADLRRAMAELGEQVAAAQTGAAPNMAEAADVAPASPPDMPGPTPTGTSARETTAMRRRRKSGG